MTVFPMVKDRIKDHIAKVIACVIEGQGCIHTDIRSYSTYDRRIRLHAW